VLQRISPEHLSILEPQQAARVANVAFSRDGKVLASASWDRTIKVWDTATWKLLRDLHDCSEAAAQCVTIAEMLGRLAIGAQL